MLCRIVALPARSLHEYQVWNENNLQDDFIAVAKVPAKEARRRSAAPPGWHALRDAEGAGAGEVLCSFACEEVEGAGADASAAAGGAGEGASGGATDAAGASGSRPVAVATPGQAALSVEFIAVRGMQAMDGEYFAVARLEVCHLRSAPALLSLHASPHLTHYRVSQCVPSACYNHVTIPHVPAVTASAVCSRATAA